MSKVSRIEQAIKLLQTEIKERENAIAVLRSVQTKTPKRKPRPLTAVSSEKAG